MILVGLVGGASQTNGISWLTWRYFPAIPLLSVLLKVVSTINLLENFGGVATNAVAKKRYVC